MTNLWGNDEHGPGGDPSWLGGKDRDGAGLPGADRRESGPDGWSSDFSSADLRGQQGGAPQPAAADFPHRRDPDAAESMAPRFGERTGEIPDDRDQQSPWMSSFREQDGEGRARGPGSIAGQVLALLGSSVGVIIFAVVFLRMGFDMWWILLIVGVPLISRVVRLIRRNLGG
jgi:hypothetical protein